ncbi:permease for cytosine/purines, uracil, thiamine, allantoin-domain-containing protein [Coniochaeta sp. 2T2.1]|nr:permease for cytosine/purines, uracil, thiamine, allantoin-domain-containing protein [Coniochaeta sp. 2T2.1]
MLSPGPNSINIRRGTYITALFSVVVNPWKLVNTATVFLTVLSSYSVFLGPMTGLMVASYLVVSRRKVNVDDLYRGDKASIYWFTAGFNWRAAVPWIVGFAPLMPGFIAAVNTSATVSAGATELYYMSYLYGFLASGVVFVLLHKIFPARSLDTTARNDLSPSEPRMLFREKWDNIHYEDDGVIEGADKQIAMMMSMVVVQEKA